MMLRLNAAATWLTTLCAVGALHCGQQAPGTPTDGGRGDGAALDAPPFDARLPDGGVLPFAECGARIFNERGELDAAEYERVALRYGTASIDCRLGPRRRELHPGAPDDAPTAYMPTPRACPGFGHLCTEFTQGPAACVRTQGCFGSVAGQVMYVPRADDPGDHGVDRFQSYGWEHQVHCVQPRRLPGGHRSHPDPTVASMDVTRLAGAAVRDPVAQTRRSGIETNDAVMIFTGGVIATSGIQTSRAGDAPSRAMFRFPPRVVPTAVALTNNNEFVLVTVWDLDARAGRLAVLSARSINGPGPHSWHYHGLFNTGAFAQLKLLGYVDLPVRAPTSIAAATNVSTVSQTHQVPSGLSPLANNARFAGYTGGDVRTCDEALRERLRNTNQVIARSGYAVVGSQFENKVVFVDLAPLLAYMRRWYFEDPTRCNETTRQFDHLAGDPTQQPPADVWPFTFEVARQREPMFDPRPRVMGEFTVPAPRAVVAGRELDRWTVDHAKAYAISYDGTLHIFHPRGLIDLTPWDADDNSTMPPALIGTAPTLCENPTMMRLVHHGGDARVAAAPPVGRGVWPLGMNDEPRGVDQLNSALVATCRGNAEVDFIVSHRERAAVYRRLRDSRITDPVAVDISQRVYMATVADFDGQRLTTVRFGSVHAQDCMAQPAYGVGPEGMSAEWEVAGTYSLPGPVFSVSTVNVN